MTRIGLFGGTFNPIHSGHLQLAVAAQNECGLDHVLFIPAAEPPHKELAGILPYMHRSRMVELACEDFSCFSLSTIEAQLPYPSYTIDTFLALTEMWGDRDVEPLFLIGYDAFLEIKTWKEYKVLLSKISFILCPRLESSSSDKEVLFEELGYTWQGDCWQHPEYFSIYELSSYPENVSSTGLRDKLRNKKEEHLSIPNAVRAYIKSHALYQE